MCGLASCNAPDQRLAIRGLPPPVEVGAKCLAIVGRHSHSVICSAIATCLNNPARESVGTRMVCNSQDGDVWVLAQTVGYHQTGKATPDNDIVERLAVDLGRVG